MRFTRLFLMVIVLLQLALASQAVAQPKVGVIYFLPSDRTAQSNIDSKIDTLIKAAQTAYCQRDERRWIRRKNVYV